MEEMNQLKVYTVEEANRLIPKLTEMIQELQQKRDIILKQEVEIDALELVTGHDKEHESVLVHRKMEDYNRTVTGFYSVIDEIHEMGCMLKDINMGLVDFYTLYKGRVVYLCWKLGEKSIRCWHEIGRGFTYRQPIDTEHEGRESSG